MPWGAIAPPPAVRSLGGLVLQGTQPRPEPPALRPSPAPGQGVRGGGPSPMCMHLCQEHVWAETQPTRPDGWGCSNVLSHSGIWRSGWAQRRKGLPLAATALPPGLRQALAGLPPLQALVRQPFPLRGARAARGLILLPQHPPALSHTQVLGSAKQVQATEWAQQGLRSATSTSRAALSHGVDACRYCPPGLQEG